MLNYSFNDGLDMPVSEPIIITFEDISVNVGDVKVLKLHFVCEIH